MKRKVAGLPPASMKYTKTTGLLSTLDPKKITWNDVLDLSGIGECDINVCGGMSSISYKKFGSAQSGSVVRVPFPPGTKGVFYFNDRTNVHPVAGDIRFRVLPLDRAKAQDWKLVDITKLFAEGEDLLDHTGFSHWRVSLLSIIYKQRVGLFELVKQCGYVSQAAEAQVERLRLAVAANLGLGMRSFVRGITSQILDSIVDPFILDLCSHGQHMVFLQQGHITPHTLMPRQMTTTRPMRNSPPRSAAYSGTVLVRLEMIRHEGRNRVVLRVLKFLKPPNPNDMVFQEEGKLLKKYHPSYATEDLWMAGERTKFISLSSMQLLEKTYLPRVPL